MVAILAALVIAATQPVRPPPSLRDMVEMATLSSVSVSPDQRWVVYRQEEGSIVENRRRLSWWVAPSDGSRAPSKLADGGEPIWTDAGPASAETPQWSVDGRWLYFRSVTEEGVQIWRASPVDHRVEQVTRDPADIEAFSVGKAGLVWRVRASREAIRQAERDEYDNGVRLDGAVDPAQNLFEAVNVNGRFAAQRLAGQWFQRRSLLGKEPARFYGSDLTGAAVRAIDDAEAAKQGLPRADTRPLLFSGPSDLGATSRFGHLSISRTRDGSAKVEVRQPGASAPIVCSDPLCRSRISAGVWRPGANQLVLTRVESGYRQNLLVWDIATDKVRVLAAGDGVLGGDPIEAAPCAVASTRAFCVSATPQHPPRLVAIDLGNGKTTVVAEPNASRALIGVTPQRLAWRDGEGHDFNGVFFPAAQIHAGQRPPLFLAYYTCQGFVLGGEGDEWPFRALADAGIAVLCINKTAVPAEKQDSVANYHVALSGIRAIVDQLDKDGRIDRSKIGMGGLSFGSEITMWVATESDLLRAVSISTPQLEPTYYWIHGVKGRDNHGPMRIAWGLGAPEETPDRWKLVAPALKTDRLHAATLMQMVEQEYLIGPELLSRLSDSKTPVEAYVFPQEPHIKVQPRHKLAVYQRNLDWFRFWLQGVEDPAPEKAAQYGRWRAMRDRAIP